MLVYLYSTDEMCLNSQASHPAVYSLDGRWGGRYNLNYVCVCFFLNSLVSFNSHNPHLPVTHFCLIRLHILSHSMFYIMKPTSRLLVPCNSLGDGYVDIIIIIIIIIITNIIIMNVTVVLER